MKIAIITHAQHIKSENQYYGYAPYIREMNIWLKYTNEVIIVAPLVKKELSPIHEKYNHSNLHFCKVEEFDITSKFNAFKTLFKLPKIVIQVYKAMRQADHIHLRCPGNMGLIGAVVQIFFPKKRKTAKYAGNWDPNSKQPITYRLQKWILSNTFLTRKMQVLVYGDWEGSTKNIKSFFTATYYQTDIINIETRKLSHELQFIFVGTLSKGKQPLYAVKLIENLKKIGVQAILSIYGDGILRNEIETYILENKLKDNVLIKGNQVKDIVVQAYQNAHFLVLPSKSEGWPKVVAEAMFWGCVPIATKISCVPFMLDFGSRGLLLEMNLDQDIQHIFSLIKNEEKYKEMSANGISWSRQFTVNKFEEEIQKLLL